MLDLQRLRLLRELEARGTVHGAARALDYTPSAISQQLAVLEREAGVALLERSGRNVRLTEAGQVLVRHAASLLDGVEAAEAELADVAAGRVAGVVRVVRLPVGLPADRRPRRRARWPADPSRRPRRGGRARGRGGGPRAAAAAARRGRRRRVRGTAARRPRRPRARAAVREQVWLVCPPRAIPPRGAGGCRCGGSRRRAWGACQPGTGHRAMQVRACRELGGFEPDLRHASDDFLILLELVRSAGTLALLPDLVLGSARPASRCAPLAEGAIGRDVFLAHAREPARRPSPRSPPRCATPPRRRLPAACRSAARRRRRRRCPARRRPASRARRAPSRRARACSRAA